MHFSTYLIYMDLLYECGKYDQVVEFYFKTMNRKEKEKNRLIEINHTTLFMAALYKMVCKIIFRIHCFVQIDIYI
jgi:hypothetical protein